MLSPKGEVLCLFTSIRSSASSRKYLIEGFSTNEEIILKKESGKHLQNDKMKI